MDNIRLQPSDLDALREIGNIGAGHAATALSQFLGEVVSLQIPEVRTVELRDIPAALGGDETVLVGIHLRVLGEVRGNLLLTVGTEAAVSLLERIGVGPVDLQDPSEMAASALRELGNILASTYLNAISQLLHASLVPSVPGLAVDMAGAIVDFLLMELAGVSETTMVLETAFQEVGGPVHGHVFLLPDPGDVGRLIEGIRTRS